MYRESRVGSVKVISVGLSSVVKVGDSHSIAPISNIFAVQRQEPIYIGDEGDLSQMPFFKEESPIPLINEAIEINWQYRYHSITVRSIRIIGISASSILHIGSTHKVSMLSRVKHIRQFISNVNE